MSESANESLYVDTYVRTFQVDGVLWRVRAIRASQPEDRASIHLMFECDAMVHRIRKFPENWKSLDDAALGVLGDCASA